MATEQEDTTPAAAFSLQTIHLHGLGIPHGSMCTVTLRGMGRGEEEGKPGRGGGEGWVGGMRKAHRGGVVAVLTLTHTVKFSTLVKRYRHFFNPHVEFR